jgi:hypothetical protein
VNATGGVFCIAVPLNLEHNYSKIKLCGQWAASFADSAKRRDCCNRKPDCFDPAKYDEYIVAQDLAATVIKVKGKKGKSSRRKMPSFALTYQSIDND